MSCVWDIRSSVQSFQTSGGINQGGTALLDGCAQATSHLLNRNWQVKCQPGHGVGRCMPCKDTAKMLHNLCVLAGLTKDLIVGSLIWSLSFSRVICEPPYKVCACHRPRLQIVLRKKWQ